MLNETVSGHILIVDDDTNITELLSVNLRSEGYTVSVQAVAADVDRAAQDDTCLVIVDAMQQPYSGMDLIYDFKDDARTADIGIILCSSVKSEHMVIDALDAGADDYMAKPFSLRELVARVRSVLRRHRPRAVRPKTQLSFEGLVMDTASQSARLDDAPLNLTKTEFAILELLLRNANNYVPRTDIHRSVWPDENAGANERIVDTNISRLRKKLGPLGTRIVNRSGHGYMIS